MSALGLQSLLAVVLVLGLVAALAWVARRGAFTSLQKRGAVTVETAVPLGERRSLVVVAVEGRRLLLGLTPVQVSMVAELAPSAARGPSAAPTDAGAIGSFDREVMARS
jgi:flagellar protein FliO/FliZ